MLRDRDEAPVAFGDVGDLLGFDVERDAVEALPVGSEADDGVEAGFVPGRVSELGVVPGHDPGAEGVGPPQHVGHQGPLDDQVRGPGIVNRRLQVDGPGTERNQVVDGAGNDRRWAELLHERRRVLEHVDPRPEAGVRRGVDRPAPPGPPGPRGRARSTPASTASTTTRPGSAPVETRRLVAAAVPTPLRRPRQPRRRRRRGAARRGRALRLRPRRLRSPHSSASARSLANRARLTSISSGSSATSERTITSSWLTSTKPRCTAMTCSAPPGEQRPDLRDRQRAEERHMAGQERDLTVGGATHHHLGVAPVEHPLGRDHLHVQQRRALVGQRARTPATSWPSRARSPRRRR